MHTLTPAAFLPVLFTTFWQIGEAGWYARTPPRRQTAEFNEGALPSHLPSPPKPEDLEQPKQPVGPQQQQPFGLGNGMQQQFAQGQEQVAPQPPPPKEGPSGPLGLSGTILILVPEFKYTIDRFPKWVGATVKLSFPITIFFDMLGFPPGSPPFPFPFGPWRPRGGQFASRRHFKRFPGTRRNKRSPAILTLPPPSSVRGGERALLFPKLENFLKSAGIPSGRACLLRTVCEVHETSLTEGYGLLGEIITRFFSISRSHYADSHLPEYLQAEEVGKTGDCSIYYPNCTHSIFEESVEDESSQQCEIINGDNLCD